MPAPDTPAWEAIAHEFETRWQFPNCVGAIDGKHVVMQAPANSGAMYHNYKGTFAMVLMALVDASYCFTVIDVGSYGSSSDGGIFSKSCFGISLAEGTLQLPPCKSLPGADNNEKLPHVIVGDEAFPLKQNLMRPYPGNDLDDAKRIFNYRLSRARRIVENAFGILAARWRIYQRRMQLSPGNIDKVVKSTCVLHNFLQKTGVMPTSAASSTKLPIATGAIQNLSATGNHAAQKAIAIRTKFTNYFNSAPGSVAWQRDACFGQANH